MRHPVQLLWCPPQKTAQRPTAAGRWAGEN
uniref:Uncharacterized protein n=1 Tax=Myoviridae sp. ctagO6 TaxID=2826667 RepID=A0A8S5NPN7_9CAUD|nr:MAG TPA: hypothetical protein [Myoviridae sp. ctagO6]DAG39421.1 MAG TPA: hypothetical protein [Caudoviricetes sp.]